MKIYLAILFACITSFAVTGQESHTNSNSFQKSIDSILKGKFAEDEPGGSVLIMKGDSIAYLNSFGLADMETKEKITERTVFNTGSISKTFVSNAILILQERQLLSVDDEIGKYFKDFNNPDIAKKVKIKHLLAHNSGLPDIRNVRENQEYFITAKDTGNFAPIRKATNLNFQPGEKFEYSNPAYNGLALIINQVTNQKWQQFVSENIFKPSGMQLSKITDGSFPATGVAHAYALKNGKYEEQDYGETPTFAAAGNGGIWSTVMELAAYEKALRSATFLSKETINNSRTVFQPEQWKGKDPAFIGYSWFIGEGFLYQKSQNLNTSIVSHTGSQGGFRAFYITFPEKDIVYIALFNRPVSGFRQIISDGIKAIKKHDWLQ